jgi:hypothetical protein
MREQTTKQMKEERVESAAEKGTQNLCVAVLPAAMHASCWLLPPADRYTYCMPTHLKGIACLFISRGQEGNHTGGKIFLIDVHYISFKENIYYPFIIQITARGPALFSHSL